MELILSFLFLIVLKSYSSNKSDDIHTFLKENENIKMQPVSRKHWL